jgi:type IV pilus assembly protein PilA
MAESVFLGRDGQQLGPYTRTNLVAMAARGEIRDDDLAWHEGLDDWQPAPALLDQLGVRRMAAPPPVPPPPPQPPPPKEDVRFPGGRRPDGSIHRLGEPDPEPPPGSIGGPGMPAWMQSEVEETELYRAFLGPNNAERYLAVFQRFDSGGGSATWNLAGGLITQLWMLYRGMYLWALVLYPLLIIAGGVALGAVGGLLGLDTSLSALSLILGIAIPGLYADKIYHGHARKLIERSALMGLAPQPRREWLMRKGGTNLLAPLILLVFNAAVIGMLAAIAVPAYQSYVVRAQVMEGQMLGVQVRQAVEHYYQALHGLPMDNADARLPGAGEIAGRYVSRVEVSNGTVLITFGGQSDRRIAGAVLAYVPESGADAALHWNCATETTTLENQYRPPECRQ